LIKNNFISKYIFTTNLKINVLIQIILRLLNNISETEDYVPIIGSFTKKANKPVAILKASKDIVENGIGNIFEKASFVWNFGKKYKGIENIRKQYNQYKAL